MEALEPQFRLLRSADCLRSAKLAGEPYILHYRSRPARFELFLDSSPSHGPSRAAHRRLYVRPHMEPLRAPSSLPPCRCAGGHHRDVLPSQRRLARPLHIERHYLRPHHAHASRHLHQHGHAALQNACGRYGERASERQGLLHTVVPLQRRFGCRLCGTLRAGMVPEQHRPRRRGASHRYVGLLYRCHHPGCVRGVYLRQGQGDAPG